MRTILICLLALLASACASVTRLDAANDVHALLVAIRDDDRATFDAHVDRPALKREIERRLKAEAGRNEQLRGVAAVLAPGLAELAGKVLVQPSVFRFVAERYGYSRDARIPAPVVIAQALRRLPDGRVCATRSKDGPCVLIFSQAADGRWRLSGFEGELSELRLKR